MEQSIIKGDLRYEPSINLELKEKVYKKSINPVKLLTRLQTILDMSIYTNSLAFKGTNAGIEYPGGSLNKITFPCSNLSSSLILK